jgi:autotransporter adhesin
MNNKMKTTVLSAVIAMATMGVFANPVEFGNGVVANQHDSIAVGNGVVNTSNNSIGLGNGVTANTNAIAIGNGVGANNINTIAIGNGVNANSTTSVAIGYGLTTDGNDAVNIGNINHGATKDSVLVGAFNNVKNQTGNSTGDVLIGNRNTLQDSYHGIVVGKSSTINNANYGIAIGNDASVAQDESVAIGHNANASVVTGTSSSVINGKTHAFAGTTIGTVSIGNTDKERTITNVAAGRVESDSTDAVNGSQLHAAIDEINTNGLNIKANKDAIDDLHAYVAINADAINETQKQVKTNTADIRSNMALINDNHQAITNVGAQVNILQATQNAHTSDISALKQASTSHETRITTLENQSQVGFDVLDNKVNQLERGTNKAIASVSALGALHWNGFDAHNKFSISAGFGHYKNANAGALGAFYAPNENVMFYVGQSFGSAKVTNASVNFKVGKTTNVKRDELKDLKERIEMLENLLSK